VRGVDIIKEIEENLRCGEEIYRTSTGTSYKMHTWARPIRPIRLRKGIRRRDVYWYVKRGWNIWHPLTRFLAERALVFRISGSADERLIPVSVFKWAYEKISQGKNLTLSDCIARFRPVFESDSCNFNALGGIFERLEYAEFQGGAIVSKIQPRRNRNRLTSKKDKKTGVSSRGGRTRKPGARQDGEDKDILDQCAPRGPNKPVDVNVESKRAKRPEQRSPAVAFRLPKGGTYPSTEYDVDATGWFPWPRISVRGGSGNMPPLSSPFKGIFSRHGYRVGQNGRVKSVREKILDQIFHEELSHENNAYKDQFGDPESHTRLKKMADFLASQAGNLARKNNPANDLAIEHYKMDLDYLYEEYYVKFGFDKGPESQRSDKGTEIAPQKPKSGVNDSKSTKPAPPEESDGPEAPPVERQEPPTTHEDNGEVPPASSPTPPDGDTIAPCPNTPPPPTSVLKRFFRWLRKTVNSILGRRA